MVSRMLAKVTFDYEVITPLYLGGADPRAPDDVRIRVRPIVAHWRWWFRALAGGVFGTTEEGLVEIRRREQRYFGAVHEVGDAATGPMQFRVRLASAELKPPADFTANRDPVMNYLGYGLGKTRQEPRPRLGIPPGSKFRLEVIASEEVAELLRVLNYFWTNFGGLGARHRRGLGSIEWRDSRWNPLPQDGRLARAMLEKFRQILGIADPRPAFEEIPEMPVVHRDWFRVKLSRQTFSRWKEALAAIRNQLRIEASTPLPPPHHLGRNGFGYRQGEGESHEWATQYKQLPNGRQLPYYPTRDKETAWKLQEALSQNQEPEEHMALLNPLFGLPLVFAGWNLTITAFAGGDELRRPSPLSFRVFRAGNQYKVAVVYFKSRFLPERSKLRAVFKRDKQQRECPVTLGAGWEYVDRFFDLCEGTEVRL